jgi:hypothetical protein
VDVHQIKKFAENLSASQKSQVEKSFGRALVGMVRGSVPLNDWYLVMPLDPTLDNLQDWFDEMPGRAIEALATDTDLALTAPEVEQIEAWRSAPGRVIGWKALDFCEKLAADYPYVVDYYLFGGRERIKDAVAELAKLIGRDDQLRASDPGSDLGTQVASRDAALLQPGEVREHLSRLGRVLDTDPHFRYGFGLDINRPELHLEDGLVAASQEAIPGDLWLTFKIYERSAQSLEERPIPIQLEFQFEEESDEHQAFRDWIKYGKPAEAPATITADLPGQLKRGPMTGKVSPPPQNESPESYRLRLRVVAPDATELAQLNFIMRSTRGLTNTAAWVSGTDDSGFQMTPTSNCGRWVNSEGDWPPSERRCTAGSSWSAWSHIEARRPARFAGSGRPVLRQRVRSVLLVGVGVRTGPRSTVSPPWLPTGRSQILGRQPRIVWMPNRLSKISRSSTARA